MVPARIFVVPGGYQRGHSWYRSGQSWHCATAKIGLTRRRVDRNWLQIAGIDVSAFGVARASGDHGRLPIRAHGGLPLSGADAAPGHWKGGRRVVPLASGGQSGLLTIHASSLWPSSSDERGTWRRWRTPRLTPSATVPTGARRRAWCLTPSLEPLTEVALALRCLPHGQAACE